MQFDDRGQYLSTSLRLSRGLGLHRNGTRTQGPFDDSLIAARAQRSGTGINPRRGFTSSNFQRLIENEEAQQQVLSVVQISEPFD
jgi:hypothetical protein